MNVVVPAELCLHGRYVSETAHLRDQPELDTHELAWAAGFFDGEGTTSTNLRASVQQGRLTFSVGQLDTERLCLDRFHRAVGGGGHFYQRPSNGLWQLQYESWRDIQRILARLWPYLSEPKRRQARAAFAAYQTYVDTHPRTGRLATRWKDDICPKGHTNVGMYVNKRGAITHYCRTCNTARKRARKLSYRPGS